MKKSQEKIINPITVIAIFATLSETSAAVTLPFLDDDERDVYIWFLISFPFYLLFLFFATLNFNYRSLYAPSDYEKGEHFIEALGDMESREDESADVQPASFPIEGPEDKVANRRSWGGQSIQLPESTDDLQIVDARQINKKIDFGALREEIHKHREKQFRVIVFITDEESEKWLKEGTTSPPKQTKKRNNATFLVIYNLNSQKVTGMKTCH
jgi:hypothetical protein